MRLQLALNVANLDDAIAYYSRMLAAPVHKREPGYANFVIDDPALKLVLFEQPDAAERLNHLGFEVFSDAEVDSAAERLRAADLQDEPAHEEVCCYARQNKVISYDPQGLMWEWYRLLEDSPSFFAEPQTSEATTSCTAESRCC